MKLAIDAKWYFSGPPSGVNVVKNIVDTLIARKEKFELFLILNKKDLDNNKNFKEKLKDLNISFISLNSDFNFFTNLFLINKHLKKHNIDIVLFLLIIFDVNIDVVFFVLVNSLLNSLLDVFKF